MRLASQLPKPEAHCMPHIPKTQVGLLLGRVWQLRLQAPQLWTSDASMDSHLLAGLLSQSPKTPPLAILQLPLKQKTVQPLVEQALPQAPTLIRLVERSTLQPFRGLPLQYPNPELKVMLQTPED